MGGVGINVPIQFIDVFWGEGCSWEMAMSVQDKRMKKKQKQKTRNQTLCPRDHKLTGGMTPRNVWCQLSYLLVQVNDYIMAF